MKIAHACLMAGLVVPGFAAAASTTPNCTTATCSVTVTVSGAGCGGGITVSPDPIILTKGKGVTLQWTIASPGWAFVAEKGIYINKPDAEFEGAKTAPDRKQYGVTFKNTKSGTYKYDINLVSDTKVPCSVDPTILNY